MILIEVIELVIDINGSVNFSVDCLEFDCTILILLDIREAYFVVSPLKLHNAVAHYLEDNTDGQEDHTEDAEGEHSAHGGGHRSPSW
jgi:hypothetical protein